MPLALFVLIAGLPGQAPLAVEVHVRPLAEASDATQAAFCEAAGWAMQVILLVVQTLSQLPAKVLRYQLWLPLPQEGGASGDGADGGGADGGGAREGGGELGGGGEGCGGLGGGGEGKGGGGLGGGPAGPHRCIESIFHSPLPITVTRTVLLPELSVKGTSAELSHMLHSPDAGKSIACSTTSPFTLSRSWRLPLSSAYRQLNSTGVVVCTAMVHSRYPSRLASNSMNPVPV